MRSPEIADWLVRSPWADYTRHKMAGDASARQYERLTGPAGETVILMNAPPDTCGSQRPFVTIAEHLLTIGLAAPEILDWDEGLGLMVLSDLGQPDVAQHLQRQPDDERMIYTIAAEILRTIGMSTPPKGLPIMRPDIGAQMLEPAFQFVTPHIPTGLRGDIEREMERLLRSVDPDPRCLSLRDFHAENLIWRSARSGKDRLGLLDFQDAFITHPAYDIASLLRDARRDVTNDMIDELLAIVLPMDTHQERRRAFHIFAVQRNLRILGIFHKLAAVSGKQHYLGLVPRVWSHLKLDLQSEDLATLRPLVLEAFGETLK